MNDPLLHSFEVRGRDYVYDARSNMIFETSSLDPRHINLSLDQIYRQNWGLSFDDISINGVKYPYDRNTILKILRGKMEELIIGVTDRCNFRCRYCIYSGNYHNMRTHRKLDINERNARRAIDEFERRSRENETVSLGFYGGEPLTKWDLIKSIVPYAREKLSGRRVIPNITTNGYLLTSEKFEFLRDHNFMLLVSLDGPEEIHNRNRRTIGNKPTHSRILMNLDNLRTWDHYFYENNLMFSCVFEDPFELKEIDMFFRENPLTREQYLVSGIVDQFDNDLVLPVIDNSDDFDRFRLILLDTMKHFADTLRHETTPNGIGAGIISPAIKRIRDRHISLMTHEAPTSGICIPGVRKLFVTTDGVYHPCEKAERFDLGNVYEGFSEEKSLELIQDYEEMSDGLCDNCWAVRLCPACYISGSKTDGELNQERQKMNCGDIKNILDIALEMYVELIEDRVDLKDKLEEDL